jgi:hypothetical protein
MKSGVQTIVDNVAKAIAGIEKLATTRVMVGVPAEKGSRNDGEPINNAALLYIHENGAPEAGIVARKTLLPGVKSVKDELATIFEKTGHAALDGRPEAVDRGFNAAGLKAQSAVRAKFGSSELAPLKPATIEARKRQGRTGTRPLINRSELRNAINYVIRKA